MNSTFRLCALPLAIALVACSPSPNTAPPGATGATRPATGATHPAAAAQGARAPKLVNRRLKPIFVVSASAMPPTKAQVTRRISLTNGQKTGLLPKQGGVRQQHVRKRHSGSSGYFLAANLFDTSTPGVESEGMGAASPYAAARFALDNPTQEDNAPFFEAAPGVANKYSILAAPDSVDLRPQMPPVRSQGSRGTCTLFATAGVLDYLYPGSSSLPVHHASPQFLYFLYHALVVSRGDQKATAFTDTGTLYEQLFPLLSAGGNTEVSASLPYIPPAQGYVDEADAPYVDAPDQQTGTVAEKAKALLPADLLAKLTNKEPVGAQGAYFYSLKNDVLSYEAALAGGQPITLTIPCYGDDWDTPSVDNQFRIPELTAEAAKDESKVGYHAVACVGYKRDASAPGGGLFLIRNSWGADWGDGGHCWVSYRFLMDYGSSAHVAQAYPAPFAGKFDLAPPDAPPAQPVDSQLPEAIAQEASYDTTDASQDGGTAVETEDLPAIPVDEEGLPEEVSDEGDSFAEDESAAR